MWVSCASFIHFGDIGDLLCLRELILTDQTHGAFKIIGNIIPFGTGSNAAFRVPLLFVIFPAAKIAYIFHMCSLQSYRLFSLGKAIIANT